MSNSKIYYADTFIKDFAQGNDRYYKVQQYNNRPMITCYIFMLIALTINIVLYNDYVNNRKILLHTIDCLRSLRKQPTDILRYENYFKTVEILHDKVSIQNFIYRNSGNSSNSIKYIQNFINNYARRIIAPTILKFLNTSITKNIQNISDQKIIDNIKIYYMLKGFDILDKNFIYKWFLENQKYIKLDRYVLNNTLLLANPKSFINTENTELHAFILDNLNNYTIANDIYKQTIRNTAQVFAIDCKTFFPSSILKILDSRIYQVKVPYIYTSKGYLNYLSAQKQTFSTLFAVPIFKQDLNLSNIQWHIQKTNSLYANDYINHWNSFLSSIKLKKVHTLDEVIAVLKTLIQEKHFFINFNQLTTDMIFINHLEANSRDNLAINFEITESYDHIPQRITRMMNFSAEKSESLVKTETEFNHHIIEFLNELLNLAENSTNEELLLKYIANYENPSKQNNLSRAEKIIPNLPQPLNNIYSKLVSSIKKILYDQVIIYINRCWQLRIYNYYMDNIANHYPICINEYNRQLTIKSVADFYGPNGIIENFTKQYLILDNIAISDNAAAFLANAVNIKNNLFIKQALQLKFKITPIELSANLKKIIISIGGQSQEFSIDNFKSYIFTWPVNDSISDTVDYSNIEFISKNNLKTSMTFSGIWGFYRLFGLENYEQTLSETNYISKKHNIMTPLGHFKFNVQLPDTMLLLNDNPVPIYIIKN